MTYRIPDLKFDRFAVDRYHPRPELNTYSQIMNGLKPFVRELQKEA